MSDQDKADERRARELLVLLAEDPPDRPPRTVAEERRLIIGAFQEIRAEHAAELARAMRVVRWCIGHAELTSEGALRAILRENGFLI